MSKRRTWKIGQVAMLSVPKHFYPERGPVLSGHPRKLWPMLVVVLEHYKIARRGRDDRYLITPAPSAANSYGAQDRFAWVYPNDLEVQP